MLVSLRLPRGHRISADIDSPRSLGSRQDLLESHAILHDPELGCAQRWSQSPFCPQSRLELISFEISQFQQQVPGNIIPMQAFIITMADTTIDGAPAVSAKVVSLWQGIAEMSKTLGMFSGGPIANRFGRKSVILSGIIACLPDRNIVTDLR